jgi:Domain of Unknown Function (DUF1080)
MRHGSCRRAALIVGVIVGWPIAGSAGAQGAPNTLTAAERSAGWQLLFDGRTSNGWRGYKATTMPAGWTVVSGELTKTGPTDDIVTVGQYGDYELDIDWKIGSAGNSGIFYRATEEYNKIYWSGTEYQLLDDANAPDGKSRLTAAGSAYALYPAPAGIVKPADQWNTTRIILKGAHVEHWLNGVKLLEYELWSPDWVAKVKASKFSAWPNFGLAKRGYIGIQGDHAGALALRNIKIKQLN